MKTMKRNTLLKVLSVGAASALVVATAVPASANYGYLGYFDCKSTVFNGTNYAHGSQTSEATCASMLAQVKVVPVGGGTSYWSNSGVSSTRHVWAYAPANTEVVQSFHWVVSGNATKYLNR